MWVFAMENGNYVVFHVSHKTHKSGDIDRERDHTIIKNTHIENCMVLHRIEDR